MTRIQDVARRAGVSTSTVSYVLSGRRPISEPTKARVQRAIDELNYRPHAGARALASQKTSTIGLMAPLRPDVDVNVIMQFVTGIVTRARSHDRDVLLLTNDGRGSLQRITPGLVDALVVMDVETDDPRLAEMAELGVPCILIGLPRRRSQLSCIDFDFESAGQLSVDHLADRGRQHVALIGSPRAVQERHTSYADRMNRGFTEQANERGVHARLLPCEATISAAATLTRQLLTRSPQVDGLVVHNEAAMPGVLAILANSRRELGVDLDVVVVGPQSVAATPGLPVAWIDIPAQQIGAEAVDMAMNALTAPTPELRLVSPRLVPAG